MSTTFLQDCFYTITPLSSIRNYKGCFVKLTSESSVATAASRFFFLPSFSGSLPSIWNGNYMYMNREQSSAILYNYLDSGLLYTVIRHERNVTCCFTVQLEKYSAWYGKIFIFISDSDYFMQASLEHNNCKDSLVQKAIFNNITLKWDWCDSILYICHNRYNSLLLWKIGKPKINNWFVCQRAFIEIWSTWEVWRARKMRKSCSRLRLEQL